MENITAVLKKIKRKVQFNKKLGGYIFTLPFTIGFIFFFLYPFLQAIRFSISEISMKEGGFDLVSVQLENYHYILL
ncbi:MAG: hypothetical protein ACOCV3_07270, partial [Halanaerobiales bacterium]